MSTAVKGASAAAAGIAALAAVAFVRTTTHEDIPASPFPAVGVLMANGEHWCTASVVDSPKGNVVATAAHCVAPEGADGQPGELAHDGLAIGELSFAPAFSGSSGSHPLGLWKVRAIHVDERWTRWGEDTADYAFLTVEPDEDGRSLQDAVGGRGEAPIPDWTSGYQRDVTVVGYPESDHNPENKPVSCTTRTDHDEDEPDMLYISCAGFWTGTSGSPWVADRGGPGLPGRLIGVLSGGDTDVDSTAALFDGRAKALYEKAAHG
ncbi:trypsin-like serine peptidase [Streptomyces sp. NPDC090022]|uniref:trypsin-like serine peptidase n=1 Tax=Streptomyces sp. NPDC090022 TaxID=3365920 RepID=UPI0038268CC1